MGHPLVFPHSMRVGGAGIDQMQIRVPIDDTTTWAMFYSNHHPEGIDTYPEQIYPVDYEYQWLDDKGRHIVDYIEGQDVMAWVSQSKIADRTSEHIGKSDIGVIMSRRMFRAPDGPGGSRRGPDGGVHPRAPGADQAPVREEEVWRRHRLRPGLAGHGFDEVLTGPRHPAQDTSRSRESLG